ncbi:MAG: VOC family protein [Parcubacteria group bacterium]|jgi:hypothetical protein
MPRIIHFEIPASDPEKTAKFYTDTFGWEIKKWDGPMDYWLVMTGDKAKPGIDGGIYKRDEKMREVVNTLDVPDIKEYVEKVKQSGGTVTGEIQEIPGVGMFVYAMDPEGNKFGMMQSFPDAKMA